jgi:hypothetical protein
MKISHRLIGILAMAALAVGMLGMGLNAQFNTTGSIKQTVTVGGFSLVVTTTTAGATVNADGSISCPALQTTTDTGVIQGCNFTIASATSDLPSSVTISETSTGAAASLFALEATTTASWPINDGVVATVTGDAIAGSGETFTFSAEWGADVWGTHPGLTPLTAADLGKTATFEFDISAT